MGALCGVDPSLCSAEVLVNFLSHDPAAFRAYIMTTHRHPPKPTAFDAEMTRSNQVTTNTDL
jgi:hypothetical protein